MPRTTGSEHREQAQSMVVALLTALMNPPDPGSNEAVARDAVTVDGLADDILEADAEGALLYLADIAARAIKSLGDKTGSGPTVTLQALTMPPSEPPPGPERGAVV
jgi:hypothetical protein